MALNLFSASATFLPHFGKNVIGKATGLDEYSAPAAFTILFLCVSLVLVTFVLNENNCSPIGRFIHISVVFKTIASLAMEIFFYLFNTFTFDSFFTFVFQAAQMLA